MKWIFYVIVFVYLVFRAVYGAKEVQSSVTIEEIDYGKNNFSKAGSKMLINCKYSVKHQRVEWFDAAGNVVKREPTNRVYAQEHFVQTLKGARTPALVLTFKNIRPKDAGMYECRSGSFSQYASVCVIDPLEFVDTPAEVTADLGRSITLSCQAKGDPEPRIVWKRNGETIHDDTEGSKYRVMTKYNSEGFEGLLTVTSLEPGDSGVYYCVAIQENSRSEDCAHSEAMNITLHVNYDPVFENGNDIEQVFSQNNESVNLVCAASGYPPPTYKWFRDVSSDTLSEIDEKQTTFNEELDQSTLSIIAGENTFGQRYVCKASNELGTAEKYFTILKIDKPQVPDQVTFYKSVSNAIDLDVSWSDTIHFPIDGCQIQYLKTTRLKYPDSVPREADWKIAKRINVPMVQLDSLDPDVKGMLATIPNLEPLTKYWTRLRVVNDAGESPWFMPVLASTSEEEEQEETEAPTTEEAVEEKTVKAELTSDGTFYGIFFTAGIIIIAVVCMMAMRVV
ncbi:hemicentin-1-like [Manduca sexta]|uniref:hemicentin-1-like n=1 Tax=Manduca sexta TaxID=7130 RepID=UPI00188DED6C|nr:hemicentin-1-like [Manduca sexta]